MTASSANPRSGQKIDRGAFRMKFGVSERQFYRYMREVSNFLRKYKPDYVLAAQSSLGRYYIKS